MQITVTVDINDIFTEEEGANVKDEILYAIKQEIKKEALSGLNKDTLAEISREVRKEIDERKPILIDQAILTIFNENKIKKTDYSEELVTLADYINNTLKGYYLPNGKLDDLLKKEASNIGVATAEELKTRYDMLFAMQLVTNMKNQGMLKEDVASLLLPNKE